MKVWYEKPTQVKFYNPEDGRWLGGIAFRQDIICGECGQAVPLTEILHISNENEPHPTDRIKVLEWISISEEILGDEA